MTYDIYGASQNEKIKLICICNEIESMVRFKMTTDINITIVNTLSGGASARCDLKNERILVARKNCLEDIDTNSQYVKGIIYHELWHYCTNEKYKELYHKMMNPDEDIALAYACQYWIEYIAHIETVFMEDKNIIEKFCIGFVENSEIRSEIGFSYLIKRMPYFLVRAGYIGKYQEYCNKIKDPEVKLIIQKFNNLSKQLLTDNNKSDYEKAESIKELICSI